MPGTFDPEKLKKFIAAKQAGTSDARIGGKGTVRRTHKAVRKTATADDKRLKATLNKLNVRDIPAIEEVNLFREDGMVIHFAAPKVQASIASNTYVVSGNAETKKLQDLLPGIMNQLGPDNLEHLQKIYAGFGKDGAAAGGKAAPADDDDDMPALVENFEEVAAKKAAPAPAPAKAAEVKKEEPKAAAAPKAEAKKEEPKAAPAPTSAPTPASPKVEAKKEKAPAKTPAAAEPAAKKAAETPKVEAKKEAAKTPAAAEPKKAAETPKTEAKKEAAKTPAAAPAAKKETPKAAAKGSAKKESAKK